MEGEFMEQTTQLVPLKKRLSRYISAKGVVRNVSTEVLKELLLTWEQWNGSLNELARELGVSRKQLGPLIGKAKKVMRDQPEILEDEFREVTQSLGIAPSVGASEGCGTIEVIWTQGRVIRFGTVSQVVEFLKLAS
jgi:hypothetical protein